MVTRPTIDEVQNGYHGNPVETGDLASSGDFDNPDEAEQAILEAESMMNSVFGDKVLFTSEIEDEDNAIRLLSRHKWALILGEANSEGQAGSNVTWNLPSELSRSLGTTRYGMELLEYMADRPNIGVVRGR